MIGQYRWDFSRGIDFGIFSWMIPFVILDLVLKGMALWRAGRRGQQWWFIALLLVNSLGILPAIYLLSHTALSTSASKPKARRK